jgi:hypothetical protein
VRVLTGADPDSLAPGDHVLVAPATPEPRVGSIADWARTDPLLRFVDLREVAVGLAPAAAAVEGGGRAPLPWAATRAQLEAAGWRVLAWTADQRAVLAYRERAGVRVLALAVHPSHTDLVFRAAFPTLVANLLDAYRGVDRAPLGVLDDAGNRVATPGLARVGGRDVTVSLLAEDQTRLPLPAPDDLVPETAAPLRVERPTAIAGWLLALAGAALLVEWLAWVRGPGARARAPRAAPGPR